MKNTLQLNLYLLFFLGVANSSYALFCPPDKQSTLDCYIYTQTISPSFPSSYFKTNEIHAPGLTKLSYQLTSQQWPYNNYPAADPNIWHHNIDIYIPEHPQSNTANLFIGIDTHSSGEDNDYAKIALESQMIIITLSDIPNQPITFNFLPIPLEEDVFVGFSWRLFLDDPQANEFLPAHIPMVFATIKAMDLVQVEMLKMKLNINSFILTGASKRGWTAWLTGIEDNRVAAIIPIVIDFLNTEENIERTARSYGGNWPIAFLPYYINGVSNYIGTKNFSKLMEIEDPLSYLNTPKIERLKIEKYMINASGDDFFLPDNSLSYIEKLPGENNILRILPNSGHNIDPKRIIQSSIIPFLKRFEKKDEFPKIRWKIKSDLDNNQLHNLEVIFSEKPTSIIVWQALNQTDRDFRYACNINYLPYIVNIPEDNKLNYKILSPLQGWNATFLEFTFEDGLVSTTPDFIFPKDNYPKSPPSIKSLECSTLPPLPPV